MDVWSENYIWACIWIQMIECFALVQSKITFILLLFLLQVTMLTIQQLKENKNDNEVFSKGLRCVVAGVSPAIEYVNSAGDEKSMTFIGLADQTGATKATCYDSKALSICQPGRAVLLRNFIGRKDEIIVTTKTKVIRIGEMFVTQDILDEARNLSNPPDAPVMSLEVAKQVSVGTAVSLQGRVTKVIIF